VNGIGSRWSRVVLAAMMAIDLGAWCAGLL